MINWEEFNNAYAYYGNELVIQIIELFVNGDENENPPAPSYDERISSITNAIAQKDYPGIKFHAHSLKGVVANFYDPETKELAGILEWMGTQHVNDGLGEDVFKLLLASLAKFGVENTDEGMTVIFEMVKVSCEKLLIELKQHLKAIS
jgi:hypothetical protein